jgi:hypothetical protein
MSLDKELFAYQIFNQLYGKLPCGKKSESPDFIIYNDNQRIGIELTELIEKQNQKNSLVSRYALEDKIARLAKAIFDNASLKRVMVNIAFQDRLIVPAKRVKPLAHELVSILIKKTEDPSIANSINLEILEDLPNEISSIYFDIAKFLDESIFNAMRSKWVGDFDINELNRPLEKKEKYIKSYKQNTDKIYLLITEGFVPNSWYGRFVENGKLNDTKFDKVFFLRLLSRQLYEIK